MSALGREARRILHAVVHEKELVGVLVAASLFYSLFYPSPYLHQVLRDEPVVVVDHDNTPVSRRFARWLDATEGVAVTGRTTDLAAAQASVRAGTIGGVVLIPEDFERRLRRGEPATVTTWADGSYLLVRSTVAGSVAAVATAVGAASSPARQPAPIGLANWPLFNPLGGYATFVVPAVFILILQQTLLVGMGTLRVLERHRPGVNPEPVWATLLATVAVILVLYLLQAAFMFLVSFRVFGLPFTAPPGRATLFLIPFIIANTLLGLTIGELFRRPESSTVALVLTSVPALFLSGISFPGEDQAGWVRLVAMALPTTFGIRGFVQVGEMGATVAEAWRSWGALWLQAAFYGVTAAYLMSRQRLGSLQSAPTPKSNRPGP